jgi:serine protease AprX
VVANRSRYNIRVINLSAGHPVTEPAAFDPLCQAVARAAQAGIVVVTAAGNEGRAPDGAHELGGITSPGNSPFAVTVGALNTWNTVARGDDTVAEYSSRGPTKYDLAVKPDLAAPGTRIISLEADGAYLAIHYPSLHRAGSGTNAYMQLSGTSMAAPIVSGAAALLLQGAPGLTPAQVKLALQSGASYVPDGGLMGAGAGSLNIWASRKITVNGLSALTNVVIGGLLTTSSGASFWDTGTMSSRIYGGTGIRLLSLLDLSRIWSNPSLLNDGQLNLVGLVNPLKLVAPNPLIWGQQVAGWKTDGEAIVWGTSMYDDNDDAIVWGTSSDDDAIVWGTNTLTEDEPR